MIFCILEHTGKRETCCSEQYRIRLSTGGRTGMADLLFNSPSRLNHFLIIWSREPYYSGLN